jgi:hypothetical protein
MSIELTFVSPKQILHDLEDCVTTSPLKVTKRLNRLRALCKMMKIDPDAYISRLVVAEEKNMVVTNEQINEFLQHEITNTDSRVTFAPDREIDDTVKKVIEAELTAKLNKDLTLYKITCNLTHRLTKRISKHSVFGPLYRDRKIIFVHKGGIASRLSLLDEFPEHKDEIEKNFGLGGDNDCCVIIDPRLPNYDDIRSLLVGYIHHFMIEFVNAFSCGTVDFLAKRIESVTINDMVLPVKQADKNHFTIKPDGDVTVMDIDIKKCGVFTSFNDSLKYTDEIGRTCHFTLLRYKKAFQIGKRILGAELLDIAIPHRDEEKSILQYHYYKTGQWTKIMSL